jgi:tetratricopeptide (TPR) repeat protein
MDCPRCGLLDVTGTDCPQCGVIFAKLRQTAPRVAPPRPAPRSHGSPSLLVPVALIFVALAVVVVLFRPRRPIPDEPSAVAPAAATEARVSGDGPPPIPTSTGEDVPFPTPPSLTQELSKEDRRSAQDLVDRLGRGTATEADVRLAEDLHKRYPEDKPLAALLENALVTLARNHRRAGRTTQAVPLLQRAAALNPASEAARNLLLSIQLEQNDWLGAEATARQLIALNPRLVEAWRGLGYSLLRQDRNAEAIEALRQALQIARDPQSEALLAKLEKGVQDERGLTERKVSHFNVRYDGEEHDAVGREILRALERHYAELVSVFRHEPATSIAVILLSHQRYYNASGAPAWSGGAYDTLDGRIRIPIADLTTSLSAEVESTLLHELAHAFMAELSQGTAPRQVHEGVAQYLEGKRVDNMLTPEQVKALAAGRIGGVAGFYLTSLSFVEYLMAVHGQGGINELLTKMGESKNADRAFTDVYGDNFDKTHEAWAQWFYRNSL